MFNFFRKKSSPLEKENPHLSKLLASLNLKTTNPHIYLQVLRHKSLYESAHENNERLEFLGDSILDAVVAEVLYEKYPEGKEGFLTRIRSRIVSRTSLNKLGIALNLHRLIEVQMSREIVETSLSGNALEALIGAIYLDKGFEETSAFIRKKILDPHIDFTTILEQEPDPKSRVIELAQKKKLRVYFETSIFRKEEPQSFKSVVVYNGDEIAQAQGPSKKKAEQKAAALAWHKLQ